MKKLLALSIAFALLTLTACGPKAAPEAATDSGSQTTTIETVEVEEVEIEEAANESCENSDSCGDSEEG